MTRLLEDFPSLLIALGLIGGDVTLHLTGHSNAAQPFDQAIPVLVAVFIGGRVALTSSRNGSNRNPPAS